FSELGTHDTLGGLKGQGYSQFYMVNGPYSMRGSKTMLAFRPGETEPLLTFYSFVGRDLFDHKLMQLALQFGPDFRKVRVLSSNNLKSWEVAKHVVDRALKSAELPRIDDVVIGYSEPIDSELKKRGKLVGETQLGDFARL